jgi:alcohol dehydrogenase (cytochrome c)
MIEHKPAKRGRARLMLAACLLLGVSTSIAGMARGADSANWPSFFGNDQAWSYSPLDQINRDNVKHLSAAWAFSTAEKGLGATPLVVDGTMYLVAPSNKIFALDAATGKQLWTYSREAPQGQLGGLGGATGLAMGFGLIFEGTLDNHLVAIDAKTGRQVWDTQIEDYRQCKCTTSFTPLLAGDKIVVGARGDIAHRAYIAAYDAKTGKQAWRFWAVPGKGEPGNDSWQGDQWKLGGGSTWLGGSYDPKLKLIYWGVGNPQPMLNAKVRPGDNLYTDSLVALDADTGKIKWYFQENPNDSLDFDATPEPVLIDVERNGKTEPLVLHPNKSGYTYVLNRETGKFIAGWSHVDLLNWTKGLDKDGKPIDPVQTEVGIDKLICPSLYGSRAGNHSTYSPHTGWWYNISFEVCAKTKAVPPMAAKEGDMFMGGFIAPVRSTTTKPFIAAFDPITGARKWTHETEILTTSALTATAGDLIFGGDPFGMAWALDARTGKTLWSFSTGGGISSSPISYAVGGRQYMAVASGLTGAPGTLVGPLWPEFKDRIPPVGSTLFVFALPESGKAASDAH